MFKAIKRVEGRPGVFIVNFEDISRLFFSVFIVDFEWVNVCRVALFCVNVTTQILK